jgi:hypothetical protein
MNRKTFVAFYPPERIKRSPSSKQPTANMKIPKTDTNTEIIGPRA